LKSKSILMASLVRPSARVSDISTPVAGTAFHEPAVSDSASNTGASIIL
jgi:hypothetical protein